MEPSNPTQILIADDDAAFLNIVAEVLSMETGYRVIRCDSGEAAIDQMKVEKFDVIILDYRMPGMSGLNVLQWINEQKIATPVIMLTAAGNETVAVEAMKLGAYDYIRKEYIEVDHLPVIINGVYERYLFRKEKDRREKDGREREKTLASIKMFQDTAASIGHLVNTALSVLTLTVGEDKEKFVMLAPEQHKDKFAASYDGIMNEINVITLGLRSLLSLSTLAYERLSGVTPSVQSEEAIRRDVQLLETEVSKLNEV